MTNTLDGKKGLVVGIANDKSLAWGCARAFHEAGAELAITYLNEKAEPHVRPLAEQLKAPIIAPLNVTDDAQMAALFTPGASSISCCTPLPLRRRKTCRDGLRIVPARAFCRRWIFPAIPLSGWRIWPSH